MSPGKTSFSDPADAQTDGFGVPVPQEDLVRLFWDLEGLTALSSNEGGYSPKGTVTREWLDATFAKVGEVVAEAVKAGAECGSFGLQLMPNAFEVGTRHEDIADSRSSAST